MPRPLAAAAALVLAVGTALLLGGPGPQRAGAAGGAYVHTPSPAPGALVRAGAVEVGAWLRSDAPVASAVLHVDGQVVDAAVTSGPDASWGTAVAAPADLEAGLHSVRLQASDTAGNSVERTWSFTVTDRSVRRLAGTGRVETAVEVSRASYPHSATADAAVLARADDFADALAGVPLAAAVDGPLLLSAGHRLPAASAAELRRVLPEGATVHLLGGAAALGEQVRRDVEALGFPVARHGGADRYGTAAAIAALLPPSPAAVLASGTAFPDALAVSAPAARDGLPVLLTRPDGLPAASAAALARTATVTLVGGTGAVGPSVEAAVRDLGADVRRVAGPDRYATAAAVLEAFYDELTGVAVASGEDFPDALAGARHAAAVGSPLVLTHPRRLLPPAAGVLRTHQPTTLSVYGGTGAVSERLVAAALRAAEDGPGAVVTEHAPREGQTVDTLETVELRFDRPVDTASAYVEVAGREVRGATTRPAADRLAWRRLDGQDHPPVDRRHPGRLVVHARGTDGGGLHHEAAFTYLRPDPVYATAGPVTLHLPSRDVELVGFHEAQHDGARQQHPRGTATPVVTLPSRGRGTGSRSAADVVAAPGAPILAPVTGRVVRAGSYVLYCDHTDHYAVIEPDARPGWEVKLLHFRGLAVRAGDRVVAGRTVLGAGPRTLPFGSQVDDVSAPRDWPHIHLEVVDPSIPPGPGGGC